MSRLLLHKVNGSPPARAVMMIGDILGLKFEYKEPNLIKGEHYAPEYVKKNPMKTVPLLEDDDFILADSHAISTYLINKYGGDKKEQLYPSEFKKRAIVDQRLHFDSGILFPRVTAVFTPTIKGNLTGLKEYHKTAVKEAYDILELYLENSKFLAADHITVADICAGATVTTQEKILDIDSTKYPKTKNWIETLKKESYFQKINQPGLDLLIMILHKFWEKNAAKAQNK